MNKVILMGTVAYKPEWKQTEKGHHVCTFTVLTVENGTSKGGTPWERREYTRCVVWNRADLQNLSQGDAVLIEGSLATRKWNDKAGKEHYVTEVSAFRISPVEVPRVPQAAQSDFSHDEVPF